MMAIAIIAAIWLIFAAQEKASAMADVDDVVEKQAKAMAEFDEWLEWWKGTATDVSDLQAYGDWLSEKMLSMFILFMTILN